METSILPTLLAVVSHTVPKFPSFGAATGWAHATSYAPIAAAIIDKPTPSKKPQLARALSTSLSRT